MTGPLEIPRTASELRAVMSSRGLTPKRRFGQHFLVENRIFDVVMRLADLHPEDVVLEVGTGLGTLTERLAEAAGLVVTVEIDAGLHALARDILGNQANVRFIQGDVMESKTALNGEMCEKLDVGLVTPGLETLKVVANLPYNVSTPFLASMLVRFGAPDLMVLMVQKELADNLSAGPRSKEYGPLTIMMSLLADVSVDRTLPPDVFWPKPRVDSAIVVVRGKTVDPMGTLRAFPLVRYLFGERRKSLATMLKKLPPTMGGPLSPEAVGGILERAGLERNVRAEQLEPERFLELDQAVSDSGEDG